MHRKLKQPEISERQSGRSKMVQMAWCSDKKNMFDDSMYS